MAGAMRGGEPAEAPCTAAQSGCRPRHGRRPARTRAVPRRRLRPPVHAAKLFRPFLARISLPARGGWLGLGAVARGGGRCGGVADDEFGFVEEFFGGGVGAVDLVGEEGDGGAGHGFDGLAQGGQGWVGVVHEGGVVVADDGQVVGDGESLASGGADGAEGEDVAAADERGDAGGEQFGGDGLAALEGEERIADRMRLLRPGTPVGQRGEGGRLAARGGVVGGAHHQPDPGVAQRRQMRVRLLDRRHVVRRHLRETAVVDGGVQQHHGHVARSEGRALVLGEAAAEDDAGDLLVQQHRHVLRLGQPARRPGAEHWREAELHQRTAGDLRQRREDRVLQLGQHQTHQPRPDPPQLRGPLVAQHIERRQHRLPRRVRHPGPAVQNPAHRRLADPDLLGHLHEFAYHERTISAVRCRISALFLQSFQAVMTGSYGFCVNVFPHCVPGAGDVTCASPRGRPTPPPPS
ncbi:hypothetical protein SCOCK_380010 [Actinacidiphila cocklensis]|uniref:Uncharacterized protein n=1 Tax=Actinacidiphila cocklensis TaxID=887465 RepID=A0A9W4GTM0_9ACTN|nr:hypothetical protein SCOCK_380010 [Actinacidiphila cocklensis]